ncbi:type II toxin-antitoxin system PemK/MazF family toxin [Microvirga arsenatis]|uniref:mRNA-degrading endonuclease n=1 Tax=Microvirga arsenatis TaxID=2692265 RepID=A0ABW9Z3I8_9HYPH|nr:type II toxin-antitoxin system PemK/MazF family toxin [Microvirga arsenatis]NBJ13812.1 mRNA-degrading endonuclease [Microvirga arsenatis]NBJ27264.1 mRNA-degrading endonuclease [Microvirga arsenatis]
MSSPEEPYCPDEGDYIWLNFDPQAGREQAGRRPALVLTPRKYNQVTRLCVLCPATSQVKGYPLEVKASIKGAEESVILADHVKSASWADRKAAFIEMAPPGVLAEVRAKLAPVLGIKKEHCKS